MNKNKIFTSNNFNKDAIKSLKETKILDEPNKFKSFINKIFKN